MIDSFKKTRSQRRKRQLQKEAPKQNQEAMKTVVLTSSSSSSSSSSSVKSTATATATATSSNMDDDRLENRDSCYFPGCRKDANCKCEMCLASINATLDLMPASIHRSSLTKLSASKPVPRSPVAFNPSFLSTPRSSAPRVSETPPLTSTARMSFDEKVRRKKRRMGFGFILKRLILGLSLIFSAEFGFSWLVSGVLMPELSQEMVRNLSEKLWVLQNVNEKLEFLQRELKGLVNGKVSDCSSSDSSWEVSQDDLLLCSRCTLYKSFTEEVSIWGWPLQTAGLLTAEFSSRSLTILMGRITEWSDGKSSYSTKIANQSWVHQKWSASAVQLDRNTWIIEHRLARVVENSRLISAALEFLKLRLSMELKRMKQEFWLLHAFGDQYNDLAGDGFKVPT